MILARVGAARSPACKGYSLAIIGLWDVIWLTQMVESGRRIEEGVSNLEPGPQEEGR